MQGDKLMMVYPRIVVIISLIFGAVIAAALLRYWLPLMDISIFGEDILQLRRGGGPDKVQASRFTVLKFVKSITIVAS